MNSELSFLASIRSSLLSPNPKEALAEVLHVLDSGQNDLYLAFMKEVADAAQRLGDIEPAELIVDMVTGDWQDRPQAYQEAMQRIRNKPRLLSLLDRLNHLVSIDAGNFVFTLVSRGKDIGQLTKEQASLGGIEPGDYQLVTESDWPVWRGELERKHLVWRWAFPDQPLPMAAKTHPTKHHPTLALELLDGDVELFVFAGLESGFITINCRLWSEETS